MHAARTAGHRVTNQPIKVLCADDNEAIGEAVRLKLACSGGFEWLGQLPTAERLTEEASSLLPDVVLLDIDMPGPDPFEAVQELSRSCPDVRVVMFTGHARRELIDRAFEAGAWGYLSKTEATDTIVETIRRVASGEFVLGPDAEAVLGR